MKYKFKINNSDIEFQVVEFVSSEKINQLYNYKIKLISKTELQTEDILLKEGIFELTFDKSYKIGGVISSFVDVAKIEGFYYYEIELVPKLYKSKINKDNEVFLNKTIIEIFEILLLQNGLTKDDYQFKLMEDYEKLEYVCQYHESDFDFISRWCERMGIYFYFEMGETEKLIFVDSKYSIEDKENKFHYSPISGLEGDNIYKIIQKIIIKHKTKIKGVKLKDYNPQKSTYNLDVEVILNEDAEKMLYFYGYNFETKQQGTKLATILAQAYDVNSEVLECNSTIPEVFIGFNYELENFYKDKYNKKYFVYELTKKGSGNTFLNKNNEIFSSEFKMINSDKQYRQPISTPLPKITGVMLGKIDSETENTPFIDSEGRYKVVMPFDNTSKPNGKASHWIRLSQPTGGGNKGFHFPLKKDTEVLLSFIDGNPDRPVIIGTLANSENPNLVNNNNLQENKLQSESGMHMTFDDGEKPHIKLSSKTGGSYIKISN